MARLHHTERARRGITRRGFFKAAAVSVPAAAAMVSILSGCTNSSKESVDSDPVVVEEDSAVNVTDSYTYVDSTYTAAHEWSLPLGNVLHPGEGTCDDAITEYMTGRVSTTIVVPALAGKEAGF